MTDLNKPVTRKTRATAFERGTRAIIVSLVPPNVLSFRLKGTRRSFDLTIEECFDRARKRQAAKDGAEKKGRKR